MELSIGEMLMIALVIIVLFGPDKLPQIARDLGQGVRKMRGAMEDVKTEILKETDNLPKRSYKNIMLRRPIFLHGWSYLSFNGQG